MKFFIPATLLWCLLPLGAPCQGPRQESTRAAAAMDDPTSQANANLRPIQEENFDAEQRVELSADRPIAFGDAERREHRKRIAEASVAIDKASVGSALKVSHENEIESLELANSALSAERSIALRDAMPTRLQTKATLLSEGTNGAELTDAESQNLQIHLYDRERRRARLLSQSSVAKKKMPPHSTGGLRR